MFWVFVLSFHSGLVRNSAISFRIAVNTIFFGSLVNKQLGRRAWKRGWSMVFCPNSLVFNQIYRRLTFVHGQIYHRIDGISLSSSKFGQRRLVMKD